MRAQSCVSSVKLCASVVKGFKEITTDNTDSCREKAPSKSVNEGSR